MTFSCLSPPLAWTGLYLTIMLCRIMHGAVRLVKRNWSRAKDPSRTALAPAPRQSSILPSRNRLWVLIKSPGVTKSAAVLKRCS